MNLVHRIRNWRAERRGAAKFTRLVLEVDRDVEIDDDISARNAKLDLLIRVLASRRGIYEVLRRYEQTGISDTTRLKELYRLLMATSAGPRIGGRSVAMIALYDPRLLMFVLQRQSDGLTGLPLGVAAWKFAAELTRSSN